MAYPNYNNYYPNYPQYPQYAQNPQYTPNNQNNIQNGGIVQVTNENEARNYPVAPGNSVTFLDENAQYLYVKTTTFSQFDKPKFDRYKLVKEEFEEIPQENVSRETPEYALKSDLNAIAGEIKTIKEDISILSKNGEEGE